MNSTVTIKAPSTARIAQLSESARERINNLIRCGAANTEIMFRLREEAPDLMHAHLNWWREHGYLEWLPKQPPLGQKLYYERISRQASWAEDGRARES